MEVTNKLFEGIKSLKEAEREKEGVTYALGKVAISILASELPVSNNYTRLFRGEFLPFDESVTTKGMYPNSLKVLGEKRLDAELNEMGINLHQDHLLQVAKFHQEGHSITIWRDRKGNRKVNVLTMTPFVSLTRSADIAIEAATSVLAMQGAMRAGAFTDDSGCWNSEFFSEIKEYLSEGYVPTIYVIDVPNDKIIPIEKMKNKTVDNAKGMFIENSLNGYNEGEYITLNVPQKYIKAILRFTGDPYKPSDGDFWRIWLVHAKDLRLLRRP